MAKARNIRLMRWLPGLLILAVLAMAVAACAPASSGPGGGGGGVDAGDVAPPFAMELLDGSQVTLKNLVDDEQPVFLMYFATW